MFLTIPPHPTPCGDVADPDMFFDPTRAAEAAKVCNGCYFAIECSNAGQEVEYGIWGGILSEGTLAELESRDFGRTRSEFHEDLSRTARIRHEAIGELIAEMGDEATDADVARAFGCTTALVFDARQALGLPSRAELERQARERRESAIHELYRDGMTPREIATLVEVDRRTVDRAIALLRPMTGKAREAADLFAQHKDSGEVAEALGISKQTARTYRRQYEVSRNTELVAA